VSSRCRFRRTPVAAGGLIFYCRTVTEPDSPARQHAAARIDVGDRAYGERFGTSAPDVSQPRYRWGPLPP
jgi:hypothetical protein